MLAKLLAMITEVRDVGEAVERPIIKFIGYISISLALGVLLSIFSSLSQIPVLPVIPILFGFGINALVLLSNSSEEYCETDAKRGEELFTYYKKTLELSIHTLGVGLLTIIFASFHKLLPEITIVFLNVDIVEALVFSLSVYFVIGLTYVVSSVSDLVHIKVEMRE